MQKSNKTNWWILYPFKGLRLTNKSHTLANPIFGDATILARDQIKKVVPLLRLNQKMSKGHDHEGDVTYFIENLAFKEEFDSFIAVKRSGAVNLGGPKNSAIKEVIELADKRAKQVSALLQLAFLATSKEWKTCALVDQIHRSTNNRALLAPEVGGVAMQFMAKGAFTCSDPFAVTRKELRSLLLKSCIRHLSPILMPQKSKLSSSLERQICQSAIRLSDALHSVHGAAKLLGAVTAMEILLTEQDGFEILERRIIKLVGAAEFDYFFGKQIFRDRHFYVHQGIEPSQDDVPAKATGLALLCLIRFSELAQNFRSKPSILTYLDFLNLGDRISPEFTKAEKACLKHLVRVRDSAVCFPHFANMPQS